MFDQVLSRRQMLKAGLAGVLGASASNWLDILAARASEPGQRTKNCILLWMAGGPTHKDTWDLRPGTDNGGPFRQIQTNVNGIQISEHFPQMARLMNHAAIIRSMTTPEGAHARASYNMHTGYREGQGGVVYPSIGSIVSKELGSETAAMPNFVSIGQGRYGAGFLGARHQPLVVNDAARGVENLRAGINQTQFDTRVGLLDELEQGFHSNHAAHVAQAHRTTTQRAVTLMRDAGTRAFDISLEPAASRAPYGTGAFANGCLMARRLVEAGVKFVTVYFSNTIGGRSTTSGGWDTHGFDNTRMFPIVEKYHFPRTEETLPTLLDDLNGRGLLDDTLVLWMGEFGRTPKINNRGGRDHWPSVWSGLIAGGPIQGGRVIGSSDSEGREPKDRPVHPSEIVATVYRSLGIDPATTLAGPDGKALRLVEAKPIAELF
jgi:uncharacterized protein (DUF1501 family)